MSYHPGLLYYKHYYSDIRFEAHLLDKKDPKKAELDGRNEKSFQRLNKTLTDTRFRPGLLPALDLNENAFELTTTYPGLVLGTGYTHGSNLLGEFKTGFFFDHTTGLPLIPGSSVKGLLRSVFPGLYREKARQFEGKGKAEEARFWEKLALNREKFVAALLAALKFVDGDIPDSFVERLERQIFEGLHGADREKAGHHFPMRYRDIFHDAVVVRSADGHLFADDYITPHKNSLKNPVPLQILKVRPGVTFAFQFELQDVYRVWNEERKRWEEHSFLLDARRRLELFRQILLFLGAGAKTNTGFGHFEAAGQVELSGGSGSAKAGAAATAPTPENAPAPRTAPRNMYQYDKKLVGKEVTGELLRREGNKAFFRLVNVQGYDGEVSAVHSLVERLEIGKKYPLRVTRAEPSRHLLEAGIYGFKPID